MSGRTGRDLREAGFAAASVTGGSVDPQIVCVAFRTIVGLLVGIVAVWRRCGAGLSSGGVGTPPHMNVELFKTMAKVDILHVPYKGVSGAITDLISGQIDMAIPAITAVLAYVNAGKLRALAVTATTRASQLPQVPTMHEAGLLGYAATLWFGLAAPTGTPREIVARLQSESAKALAAADPKQRFASQGAETVGNKPEQFAQFIADELRK